MLDILYVENPREKKIKNFYLNDMNYYNKNSIKMRHKKYKIINRIHLEKEEERKRNPVPKMLYSTGGFRFHTDNEIKLIKEKLKENVKETVEKAKPIIEDVVHMINNFNINFDEEEEEEIEDEEEKNEKKNKKIKEIKYLSDGDFFITKPEEKIIKNEIIENDLNNVKVAQSKTIYSEKKVDKIKDNQRIYKDNLFFGDYGKYKYTRTGLYYPKSIGKYELPEYKGKNKTEKEYFDYRKKIANPSLVYNKLNSFDEQFNKDLGEISNNYNKIKSRGRFAKNPLLKQYMDMIPIYDIYKDIKSIENRYVNSKYKFKLLPLVNNKLRSLDKLADKFYRMQQLKQGLNNLLKIQPSNFK